MNTILPGFTFGYHFTRIVIETGVLSETSRFAGRVTYMTVVPISPPNNYQITSIFEHSGVTNIRFPFRLHYSLNNKQQKKNRNVILVYAGLDLLTPTFEAWGKPPTWDLWSEKIVGINSQDTINYQFGTLHKNIVTLAPSIGVIIKFKFKNGKDIFNLQFDWHFDGIQAMGEHKAIFSNNSGFVYTIKNKLSAQGLIFKIARDLNFGPKNHETVN